MRDEVSNYLDGIRDTDDQVGLVLDNIGKEDKTDINNKVVLTLLSTEEESTLKNKANYQVVNGKTVYKSIPAYLNLYVMFAANRDNYERALKDVSDIVAYFQDKPLFTNTNTVANANIQEFKFMVDLYSLRFEQLSYAWGVLGGKVMPSALYKISVIKLEKEKINKEVSIITSIDGETSSTTKFYPLDDEI